MNRNRSRSSIRVILFDWDGTLLDSFAADCAAYASMFSSLRIPWNERQLARHYSPNWHRVYRAAGVPPRKWRMADRLWMRAYQGQNPSLIPYAQLTVRRLHKHFQLGVVSSGSRWRVRKQVRALGLERYFDVCVCGDDIRWRKPHPAPLHLALKRLGARPSETVYVGDAPEDIQMARRARVSAIGVLGPFPTAKRLFAASPEVILRSVRDLPRYLAGLPRSQAACASGLGRSRRRSSA